jgi:hypothetical protein
MQREYIEKLRSFLFLLSSQVIFVALYSMPQIDGTMQNVTSIFLATNPLSNPKL